MREMCTGIGIVHLNPTFPGSNMFLPLHLYVFSTTVISKVDDLNLVTTLTVRNTYC